MSLKFYRLVTIHRKGSFIKIYARSNDGEKEKIIIPFRPYFYVPANRNSETEYKDLFGNPVKIIYARDPSEVPDLRKFYDKHYEADIPYTRRFLIDTGVKSYFVVKDQTISPIEPNNEIPLRVWFLDIEVFPGETLPSPDNPVQPITAITIYDSFLEKYYTLVMGKQKELKKEGNWLKATFDREFDLLIFFSRLLLKLDPDIITGWNIYFDVDYLKARFNEMKIPLDLSRCEIFDLLAGYKSLYRRPHYSLKDVARYENISDLKKYSMRELRSLSPDDLAKYNYLDVRTIVDLDKKLSLVDYYVSLKETAGVAHIEDYSASKLLDTILLRIAKKLKIVLPSKPSNGGREPYEGGLVLQPKMGIYENVADIDINRCYPSIIRAFNISPETLTTKPTDNDIQVDGKIGFKRYPRGILSTMVDILWSERDKLERVLKTLQPGTEEYHRIKQKRNAVKGILNAVYGFTGYVKSRIFDVRLAKTITKLAREILTFLINYYKTNGLEVIYADTDGCFIKVPLESAKDWVTKSEMALNTYLKEKYNVTSTFSLKVEKYAKAIFFSGVKKRYAAHIIWENDQPCDYIDITGFEAIRRDTPEFLQKVLKTLLEMVLKRKSREEIISYLKKSLEEYKTRPIEEICMSKAITKPFDQYKVLPPHVRGAVLANLHLGTNLRPGDRVKMLWVKHVKGVPNTDVICFEDPSDLPGEIEIDWDRMFETSLKNKVETILEPYGITWRDLKFTIQQKALDKWL